MAITTFFSRYKKLIAYKGKMIKLGLISRKLTTNNLDLSKASKLNLNKISTIHSTNH